MAKMPELRLQDVNPQPMVDVTVATTTYTVLGSITGKGTSSWIYIPEQKKEKIAVTMAKENWVLLHSVRTN